VRIIAGEHRGRILKAPKGLGTRPMLDRVREALFSSLGQRVDGARVLDLFAGTGSLGLESLSRGAASARLVESDRTALAALRTNVATLRLEERADVVAGDALEPTCWGEGARYDLVFFDPPYPLLAAAHTRASLLGVLGALLDERLEPGGCVVFHTPRGGFLASELAPTPPHRLREYGTNALWTLEARGAEAG
jgi:16S rRNA (guanine966-N2)-methyltransferase